MNISISDFLQKQTSATICCTDDEGNPWCFSCFYDFNQESGLIYFKSGTTTTHSGFMKNRPVIAGTVLPDKLNKLLVKGVQFQGELLNGEHPLYKQLWKSYHHKFPLARLMPGDLCIIRLDYIKMTDSTKGFGKKISWSRAENNEMA